MGAQFLGQGGKVCRSVRQELFVGSAQEAQQKRIVQILLLAMRNFDCVGAFLPVPQFLEDFPSLACRLICRKLHQPSVFSGSEFMLQSSAGCFQGGVTNRCELQR